MKRKKIIPLIVLVLTLLMAYSLYKNSEIPMIFNLRDVAIGIVSGLCVLIVNFCLSLFMKRAKLIIKVKQDEKLKKLDYLFSKSKYRVLIVLIAAIIEEYMFRSYLLMFTMDYMPVTIAIIINVVMFYFMHKNSQIVQLILMALVFCLITIYTGNILPAIIAHFVNNYLSFMFKKYKLKSYDTNTELK